MSHFTVMVIGNDPDEQLAPYHEFECTGEDDQFVQDVDITQECIKEGLDYYGLEDRTVESEAEVDKTTTHKYGYAVVKDGQTLKAVKRTNPNAKWDWYSLGGRWSNYLLLKNGERVDSAYLSDIDFKKMQDEAEQKCRNRYDVYQQTVGDLPVPDSWESVRLRNQENIDKARDEYSKQPAVEVLNRSQEFRFDFNLDKYLRSLAEQVFEARANAGSTFAVVKDGK